MPLRLLLAALALVAPLAAVSSDSRAVGAAPDAPPSLKPPLRDRLLRPDNAAQRRDLEIFQQACAACHGLRHLPYLDLGRLELTAEQICVLAAERNIPTLDADGQPTERPATAADLWMLPWPNENAGRAQHNSALSPNLSLITKARPGGAPHVAVLLQCYADPPPGEEIGEGQWYNRFIEGRRIAMAPPLAPDPGQFVHADGTENTPPPLPATSPLSSTGPPSPPLTSACAPASSSSATSPPPSPSPTRCKSGTSAASKDTDLPEPGAP